MQLNKHLIEPHQIGDIGLLEHEAKKPENFVNLVFFGVIVLFISLSLGVLCYKMYYYTTKLSGALIIVSLLSMILEIFVYRIVAWWVYTLCIK